MHYLPVPHQQLIYMVFVYSKDEAETLTRDQKWVLSAIVRQIKAEYSQ